MLGMGMQSIIIHHHSVSFKFISIHEAFLIKQALSMEGFREKAFHFLFKLLIKQKYGLGAAHEHYAKLKSVADKLH